MQQRSGQIMSTARREMMRTRKEINIQPLRVIRSSFTAVVPVSVTRIFQLSVSYHRVCLQLCTKSIYVLRQKIEQFRRAVCSVDFTFSGSYFNSLFSLCVSLDAIFSIKRPQFQAETFGIYTTLHLRLN